MTFNTRRIGFEKGFEVKSIDCQHLCWCRNKTCFNHLLNHLILWISDFVLMTNKKSRQNEMFDFTHILKEKVLVVCWGLVLRGDLPTKYLVLNLLDCSNQVIRHTSLCKNFNCELKSQCYTSKAFFSNIKLFFCLPYYWDPHNNVLKHRQDFEVHKSTCLALTKYGRFAR